MRTRYRPDSGGSDPSHCQPVNSGHPSHRGCRQPDGAHARASSAAAAASGFAAYHESFSIIVAAFFM